ncbi:hypothetical protein AJ78_00146 [Emergomyces pasteurianus Ep9510]|uniref:Aminoglycoside phosphotransferase domain-containing protein n=1 Tax=Emergomyces pasteurianus Ep9510 TaxID=1447872 RepID=A0A1J9PU71_9EURO|nr:hypothetical protein AJ78_00146 [Emergomyces pasteurianus Ep9510]
MAEQINSPSSVHPSGWEPVPLPYFRPQPQLPGPLPTEQEIAGSETVFRNNERHHCVVAIGPHYVVKYGLGVRESEGQTMLFLDHMTQDNPISIPKLYAMYRVPETGLLYLVMERLAGVSLENIWAELTEDEKSTICGKLKAIFDTVHGIAPPNFYGTVTKGPIPHHLFYSREKDPDICGPFASEFAFNRSFVKNLRYIWALNERYSHKADFYAENIDAVFHDHPPMLTHGDLQRKNVIVRRVPSQLASSVAPSDFEVALIDWEASGWYPSYWEYCGMFMAFLWDDDWAKRFAEIVAPCPNEAPMLRIIFQDLFF